MIESWFEHINAFLLSHPHAMAQLAFLFRLKCALLTILALYFVYRAYKPEAKPKDEKPSEPVYEFEA